MEWLLVYSCRGSLQPFPVCIIADSAMLHPNVQHIYVVRAQSAQASFTNAFVTLSLRLAGRDTKAFGTLRNIQTVRGPFWTVAYVFSLIR